jgi:hypothetical protein
MLPDRVYGRRAPALAGELAGSAWYFVPGVGDKWPLVVGALLASFVFLTNARAVECFSSAEAVRQQQPEAWPSWTLRAPGHEGAKCWYATTRGTAHQHPTGALALPPAATVDEVRSRAEVTVEVEAPSRVESTSPPRNADQVAMIPFTTAIAAAAIADVSDPTPTAMNTDLGVRGGEVNQSVAELPRDRLSSQSSIARGPAPTTDPASSAPALLAVFGGALVFASLMAALLATLSTDRGARRSRPVKHAFRSRATDAPWGGAGSSAKAKTDRLRRREVHWA